MANTSDFVGLLLNSTASSSTLGISEAGSSLSTTLLADDANFSTPADAIDLGPGHPGMMGNFSCDMHQPTLYTVTQFLYGIVCIVGLLGNTLVIYVVLRFSKMQTVTNMYIVNLAVADECFLIGIPFLLITINLGNWPFGDVMCKVYMTTTSINQFTSSIFLTIMSADRYIAVCHPISSPKIRTPLISKVVSLMAWTASALLMVPVIMYARTLAQEPNSCNIIWPESGNLSGQTAFTLYSFVLSFAVPLLLIFVFYFLVIRKLRTVGPKNKSKEKKRSHRKVTKLVLTVITVYVLCWLPYWITQVALIFTPPNQCQPRVAITIFLLAGCLSYSNSAMNPILYAFLSDNFKKSFLKACTCAAGKDVNATLHNENSVFPRRHHAKGAGSERPRGGGGGAGGATSANGSGTAGLLDEETGERGPLVSRVDTSTTAITMTSRSNITVSSEARESTPGVSKVDGLLQPTQV
ncbi:somatostatin receptor type 2-like [Schistocerca cancellata]|uniref:somatostatin receptor type 2-like n=1 Tax=Schistocerca cancellata TaxID=274614 RepID=UPI0021182CC1|nr:somatostatin receptor type 2-like [Schistocerca cancellata]